MTGRPSLYTPELAAEICERLAAGNSLRAICLADDMPGRSTVGRWLEERDDFRDQYARAREVQAHSIAETALDEATSAGDPRLAFDARKWFASKVAPKVYGDKLTLDATVRRSADEMTDDELATIAAGGSGKAPGAEAGSV